MVNKKGFLRVIEATIAVILVIAALLLIASYRETSNRDNLNAILPQLLNEIAKNETLRNIVLTSSSIDAESALENFLALRIDNPNLDFKVKVCSLSDSCSFVPAGGTAEEVFVDERVISTSLNSNVYSPKKVRLFLWEKA